MSGISMKKNVLSRLFAVLMVLTMVLPMAGCFDGQDGIKEGFIKNMEVSSCKSKSTIAVVNNLPGEQLSPQAAAFFSLLEKGLVADVAIENETSMKMVLTPKDGDLCQLMGWSYPQAPSFDFYVDKGKIALKTSADSSYLVIDPADAGLLEPDAGVDLSAMFGESYMQGQIERAYEFMESFYRDFSFPFSRVESLGTVELNLPDGLVETRRVKIDLDFEEILDLVTYLAEYLAKSDALRDYMLDSMREPMKQMVETGALPPEGLPSEEEMEELAETSYRQMQDSLSEAVKYLHAISPAMLKNQYGLDLSAEEEYFFDAENFIRKTKSTYRIKAQHASLESVLGTPQLDLTINLEQLLWDINKPVKAAFPAADEQLSLFAIMADPALREEAGEGPLSLLVNLFASLDENAASSNSLVLDLENNLCLLNGQTTDLIPAPYAEGETLMVPFRALAELAGGEIEWLAEKKQARYQGCGVEIKVTSGSRQAFVNGLETDLPVTAAIKNGRLMVPAGLAGEMALHFAAEKNVIFFVF